MSSPGINLLQLQAMSGTPGAAELYAKQLAIQRRQNLAQSLLEQGQANTGASPYGGLRSAGNAILGAYLTKNADKDTAALYATPQQEQQNSNAPVPLSQQDVSEPQISNVAGTGPNTAPNNPQPPTPGSSPSPQALGAALQGNQPMPPAPQPRTIPQVLGGIITTLPGMTSQQSIMEFANNNDAYWKALNDSKSLTPQQKEIASAFPNDPVRQMAALQGIVGKAGQTRVTPGGGIFDAATNTFNTMPNQQGLQNTQGLDGQWRASLVPGAAQANAQLGLARDVPDALTTPKTQYGPDNLPINSNALAASGNAALAAQMGLGQPQQPPQPQQMPPPGGPNINANNPLNMQPGGQQARYTTPTAGIGTAYENLGRYGAKGINTVNKIVSNWAPQAPAEYAQNVARQLGVSPDQPLDLSNPNVKGALIDAMRPNETGTKYGPGVQSNPALRPELPPGVAAGAQALSTAVGGAAGKEYADTKTLAADVPTRLNVLQSILNLSKLGAPTGSTEWQNAARETVAALAQSTGVQIDANNPAALMTEIQKYMGQYANRMAAGQGGTGTDKQLEAVEAANPHETMFASTLQRVVPWIMANERGTMAKANFLDAKLQASPNNPNAANSAQAEWRNAYQPRVAQFEMMTPQQQAGYLNDPRAFKNAADRLAFIQAAQKLHPFFKGVPGQ